MKFTLSWLKQFLDTNASLEQITNTLTMIGLEIEEVVDRSSEFDKFYIAEIVSTSKHPDADKLQICRVRTYIDERQIVCGASNARAGIKVVLADIDAIIPNGDFKIKKSKIRGVESCGMLCSAEELNIGADSDGIIELPEDTSLEQSFAKFMGFDDPTIYVNVTPNRGDALGVYGIARDLEAAGIGVLKSLSSLKFGNNFMNSDGFTNNGDLNIISDIKVLTKASYSVIIEDEEACPFFATRLIEGVSNNKSPRWLAKLLNNIGLESISPVVDVTNYVCLSFGQPMHAYDASKIAGDITIGVLGKSNSFKDLTSKTLQDKFEALNDKEYDLKEGDLVIKDAKEILCLAGIIGGKSSGSFKDTSRIILESANFNSDLIANTSRRLVIDTHSRYRFERKIDHNFIKTALDIASNMIMVICGGSSSDMVSSGREIVKKRSFSMPYSFIESRAGFDIGIEIVQSILEKLDFGVTIKGSRDSEKLIDLVIPSARNDVSIKEDIVEEVMRIYGYDKLPEIVLPGREINRIITKPQRRASEFKRILAASGYDEVVTWSFTDSKFSELFGELKEELFLQNPISSDLDYMRGSIIPNLLKIAKMNINRGFGDLSIFELGPVFENASDTKVINHISGIRLGNNIPHNAHEKARALDVFDIKADLETLLSAAGLDVSKCMIKNDAYAYYHPTKSASFTLGKSKLAYLGEMHPKILKAYDIECPVIAFELFLSELPVGKDKYGMRPEYQVSNYQMVSRDFAFVVGEDQPVGEIIAAIKNSDKTLIQDVSLFDIYAGSNIEQGKKSIAIRVHLQDATKTLTEEGLIKVSDQIILLVSEKFKAALRS